MIRLLLFIPESTRRLLVNLRMNAGERRPLNLLAFDLKCTLYSKKKTNPLNELQRGLREGLLRKEYDTICT
jgi:hypothetical protein